jgi:endonuclease/exonuclease/phosphatase family metal-dependent hydrolase
MWSDYAYGRNAVYPEGHHGNAVLSRFPIEYYENRDISVGNSEKRGLLYCRIVPPQSAALHVICVHLGLRADQRQAQLTMLAEWVNTLPAGEPVVVAGDFNDWRQQANQPLKRRPGWRDLYPRPRTAGAHLSGQFSAAAPRPHLRQKRPRQPPEGAALQTMASSVRSCPA